MFDLMTLKIRQRRRRFAAWVIGFLKIYNQKPKKLYPLFRWENMLDQRCIKTLKVPANCTNSISQPVEWGYLICHGAGSSKSPWPQHQLRSERRKWTSKLSEKEKVRKNQGYHDEFIEPPNLIRSSSIRFEVYEI